MCLHLAAEGSNRERKFWGSTNIGGKFIGTVPNTEMFKDAEEPSK